MTQQPPQTQAPTQAAPIEIWDPAVDFPNFKTLDEPRTITHTLVERAKKGGYHYLHESSLAFHKGRLFVCYANHRRAEINVLDEVIRGNIADGPDYLNFGPALDWVHPPMFGGCSFNHCVIAEHQGKLWGFVAKWTGYTQAGLDALEHANGVITPPGVTDVMGCEVIQYDDNTGRWNTLEINVPSFVPFGKPTKLKDGNWLISGESTWYEAAVIISHGDDWKRWRMVVIPRPDRITLRFPETAVYELEDRLVAVCRPKPTGPALASFSFDNGSTWQPLTESNFPISSSQPFAGTLSNGRHFLITNHHTESRALLTIALTKPGERYFSSMYKIRHQQYPVVRLWEGIDWRYGKPDPAKTKVGSTTQWSYPFALERDGKLYVSYTMGKEDCVMSVIPISALEE